jgi:hypothetical protein
MKLMAKDSQNQITFFALTDFRNLRKRFGIKERNRHFHIYLIGKTGTGKSTLIKNMAISDLEAGKGLALIDPHGDLAEDLLNFVPKRRIKDVIYFNPADLEYPIPFNPLEKVSSNQQFLLVSGLISVFKKIWSEFWGPRLEHILRNSLFSLLEVGATLLDLPRLLTDSQFRKEVLKKLANPQVREFWLFEFEKYSSWLRSEAISPILNKVSQFLTSPPLRNIIGQRENSFELREVMDQGKILIANLAKGRLGEENSSLLGSILVTKLQLAALSRADLPEIKRRPFYLYVDEFQNFLTLSFSDILSEARKYGLYLILSHQYLGQLEEKIREAIFGNVGTIISFRIGIEDAQILAREFYPIFNQEDLIKLPNYHIYLKLMINGKISQPFSAITLPPAQKKRSFKEKIIDFSRKTYAKPRESVERESLRKIHS